MLKIKNLQVKIKNKVILNNLNLSIEQGETVVVMGPNGSGKSTLSHVVMGDPKFKVVSGTIKFLGKDIVKMSPEERAQLGLFMAFQHPREIQGVQLSNFLFASYKNIHKQTKPLSVFEFRTELERLAKKLKIKPELLDRDMNYGFSGGEKKKMEILQLEMLQPKFTIFDETDSGLDVDALKIIGSSIQNLRKKGVGSLVVTHFSFISSILEVLWSSVDIKRVVFAFSSRHNSKSKGICKPI